jgi:adenylosuccinate synthase
MNLVGNGVVIDPITFEKEMIALDKEGIAYKHRLFISKKAHLIIPSHRMLDAASEASKGKAKIGSTLKGIGPTYMDKTGRNGLRVGDIFEKDFQAKYNALKEKHLGLLKQFPEIEFDLAGQEKLWFDSLDAIMQLKVVDGEYYINEALADKKKVLAEGAQGSMLDIDYGTYPFVTSSNTISAGVCNGLGVAPSKINEVMGIAKAYCTRVGSGPFPTEQDNAIGETMRAVGHEFGSTTGRARRCGWIDIPQLNYTIMINGVTQVIITKLDVLNDFNEILVGETYNYEGKDTHKVPFDLCSTDLKVNYSKYEGWNQTLAGINSFHALPEKAKYYMNEVQAKLGTKISMISTGPERSELIIV